jgi:glycosyltransferase involved in cell wall biosynthesis
MIGSELAQNRFALVASHFALYTLPVLDLIQPYPLVIHFHGPWASEGYVEGGGSLNTKVKFTLERAVYRHGTRFITLSEAFRDILHRFYKVPRERIQVVPGGVEARRFATILTRREAREQLGWPLDRPTLVTVRRLSRRMGLASLIGAIKEVRRRVPDILLLIGGKGRLSEELSARVLSLGLEGHVRFLGFVSDEQLPLAYRAADLTVVPTATLEGFGLIAVESLAAGTPVLVTPVGGLPEVVRDLSPALILPGTGVRSLAEGIGAALTGELSLPSARTCEGYVRSRYDWPVVAARVRGVYEEALS